MQSGCKKVIGLILALIVIVLFVKYFYFISVNNQRIIMNTPISTQTKFECPTLPGLTFTFPVFANWKYQGTETRQPSRCDISVQLPKNASTGMSPDSPDYLSIIVFKTKEPSSLVGQIKLRGINKNNIDYTLYNNNELRFKDNNETIIIMIVDEYTFGGTNGGSKAFVLPAKENSFDYDEFWKQVIESLKYEV